MSLREQIAAFAAVPRYEDVEIPEAGLVVRIRMLPGTAWAEWKAALDSQKKVDEPHYCAGLLVVAASDPATDLPAFSADDVPMLASLPLATLSGLALVALRLNRGADPKA